MRVVFCASEMTPFAKTGGLADVCGSLPRALKQENIDVSVVMPFYGEIDAQKFKIKNLSADIFFTRIKDTDVYFIKNEKYFNREDLYGDSRGDYEDNLERFSFFCRRTLRFLKEANLKTDILHCHDWQTALIPIYLKNSYSDDPFYQETKSVLTIHNLAYQGLFPADQFSSLGLSADLNGPQALEYYGRLNLLKAGIVFSDAVTTVSPQYAQEIKQKEFGCGLDGVIRYRKDGVVGILNGIDLEEWNPKADSLIKACYWPDKMHGKAINKKILQEESNLVVDANIPLFGFVGRLVHQKGLDLFASAVPELMKTDVQFVFEGVGDEKYQKLLKDLQKEYPKRIVLRLQFDEKLAHQIYAGSDFFMLPSTYEPCGLSQMISFRYGTIPVIYSTGGLADTVMPYNEKTNQGDGFVFKKHEKEDFIKIVQKATKVFRNKKVFEELVAHVMKYDFSWATSAKEYKDVYQRCLS